MGEIALNNGLRGQRRSSPRNSLVFRPTNVRRDGSAEAMFAEPADVVADMVARCRCRELEPEKPADLSFSPKYRILSMINEPQTVLRKG
jgi:hypothetical protein